jgi:hypothetical protein
MPADTFNGNFLSRHLRQIDEVAASTNTNLLSAFIDSGIMARVLDDEQLVAMPVPPVTRHDPNNGLSPVRAIFAAIQEGDTRLQSRRGDDDTEGLFKGIVAARGPASFSGG